MSNRGIIESNIIHVQRILARTCHDVEAGACEGIAVQFARDALNLIG